MPYSDDREQAASTHTGYALCVVLEGRYVFPFDVHFLPQKIFDIVINCLTRLKNSSRQTFEIARTVLDNATQVRLQSFRL